MTNSSRIVALSVVAAAWAWVAAADVPSFPGLGSRVRVTSSALRSGPLVGTLTGLEEKSLAVQAKGRSEAVVLERQEIRRLEWRVRPSRRKKGTLIGLGLGFAAGFGGTVLLGNCNESVGPAITCVDGYAVIYGLLGAGVGAATGALASPGERWAEVSLDRIPSGGGLEDPHPRFQLSVVPMMGARRGLTVVGSFR